MKRIVTLVLAVVLVSGCQSAVTGTPQPEPRKIDCDLIFPGPSSQ